MGYAAAVVAAALAGAEDKGGERPTALDVSALTSAFDVLVIVSGRSDRQVRTIAEEVERVVGRDAGASLIRVEGLAGGEWVALDYADVIVHVLQDEAREYYDLEHLWSAAPAFAPASLRVEQ